jgi:hypothetical protein
MLTQKYIIKHFINMMVRGKLTRFSHLISPNIRIITKLLLYLELHKLTL